MMSGDGDDEQQGERGPNDTRHVVWAPGMLCFSFFLYLTNSFICFRYDKGQMGTMNDGGTRPKSHVKCDRCVA